MKFLTKVILGTAILSNLVLGDGNTSSLISTAALTTEQGAIISDKKLLYLAKDFHTMATLPGFSLGAPSGLVPGWGVMFGGVSVVTNREDTDGALAMGFGFGDPFEILGGAATLGIGSIDPRDGGAFNRGALNLTVGHHFKKYTLGTAVGVTGIDLWHEEGKDELDPSFYGSVTKLFSNDIVPITVTAGLGNNGYVDVKKSGDRKKKVDGFGAVAFYLLPQMSMIVDYTMGITTAGISVVPFPDYPININLGATDIFEEAHDVAFLASVSAAYVF